MVKIKAVFFDLDNTLYSYEVCNQFAKDQIFKFLSKKVALSQTQIKKLFDQARHETHQRLKNTAASHHRLFYFQTLLEKINGRTSVNETLMLYDLFWKCYFQKMRLHPGWLKILKKLKQKNIKILILTDLTAQIQLQKLKKLKIDRLIDFVVTSEEAGVEKPHAQIFKYALQKISGRAEQVVMIGDDQEKDIRGAQKAGLKSIFVNHVPNLQLFDKIFTI
jgi:putative hydrolase of the HAD superfamily